MKPLLLLIDLAGAVALLLWGVRMVQTGVQRAYGPRLRLLLAGALRRRFNALLAGLGVTALLQSSTATGLMVTGLAADGVVELVPALAVMLGANIGTTVIVQILAFDISRIAPAFIVVGLLMFRRGRVTRTRDLGRVAIGLGLILLALHQLIVALSPYENAPFLREALGAVASQPVVVLLVAAALTWAAHSSVAVVLLVMSLAGRGVVSPEVAFVLVLGANLGTAINPVLEGTTSEDPAARRLPIGNLLNRVIGCIIALLLMSFISPLVQALESSPARAVADFHTFFNLVMAALFFPVLPFYATFLHRLLPAGKAPEDPSRPLYLNKAALETPAVAIGAASREALRLVDLLDAMLCSVREAFTSDDRQHISDTKRLDDALDKLSNAIKVYATALDREAMTEGDHERAERVLTFVTNIEHAGDIIDNNLMTLASKRLKRGLAFSPEGRAELAAMIDRLIANTQTAGAVFVAADRRAARTLVGEKEVFRDLEAKATQAHFARLRERRAESAETSTLHLDLLRDLKQVNADLVAAAAYPVLKNEGDLLPTRLRQDEE